MKKFRVFIDMEKEEQYLKSMSENGWGLVSYNSFNFYTFEKIDQQSLNYRIDYQLFKNKADFNTYLTLFEDSGWRHISGNKSSGFHFFLPKEHVSQEQTIFSDSTSSNERYKHLYTQSALLSTLMIFYLILLKPSFNDLPRWYLTPMTWEHSGLQLLGIILVETFFVFIRIIPFLFILIYASYYAIVGTKAKRFLKKNQLSE